MKKQLFFIVCIVCFVFLSHITEAQFKFGMRAGISSSNLKMDDVILEENGDEKYKIMAGETEVGFHGGFIARVQVLSFYVQPELLLSNTGGKVKVKDLVSGETKIKEQNFNRVDIPIIAGYRFGGDNLGLRFQVGPVANIIIDSKSDLIDAADYSQKFKSATWGYQAGVGIDLWNIGFDIKYESNLSDLGESISFANREFKTDTRNSQWLFSLALFF